nr:MAG TPA: hypothetical protein [Caudoviricetes sp.]
MCIIIPLITVPCFCKKRRDMLSHHGNNIPL